MARVQLALNVSNVDEAVEFYEKLFGVGPAKRRPGYANFAVEQPPLKLVLIENPDARGAGVAGALNHLGVEVESSELVGAAAARLTSAGLATATEDATTCCYAVQDKVWVDDPDGAPWEVYTVLADAEEGTRSELRITAPGGSAAALEAAGAEAAGAEAAGSACACGPTVAC